MRSSGLLIMQVRSDKQGFLRFILVEQSDQTIYFLCCATFQLYLFTLYQFLHVQSGIMLCLLCIIPY